MSGRRNRKYSDPFDFIDGKPIKFDPVDSLAIVINSNVMNLVRPSMVRNTDLLAVFQFYFKPLKNTFCLFFVYLSKTMMYDSWGHKIVKFH